MCDKRERGAAMQTQEDKIYDGEFSDVVPSSLALASRPI